MLFFFQANIMRYSKHDSTYAYPDSRRSQLLNNLPGDSSSIEMQFSGEPLSLNAATKDIEMPMPPLALAPLQQDGIR